MRCVPTPLPAIATANRKPKLLDRSNQAASCALKSKIAAGGGLNWGIEAFRKREAAYRLPIAFPGGGALAASIWLIADYQECDRPLNQLDRT